MLKKGSILVVLILCLSVCAASAEDAIVSQKSVSPAEVYLYGSGCVPDKTTVTLEVDGYGGTVGRQILLRLSLRLIVPEVCF